MNREEAEQIIDLAIVALAEMLPFKVERDWFWIEEHNGLAHIGGSWLIPHREGKKALAIAACKVIGPDAPAWCLDHGHPTANTPRCTTAGAIAAGHLTCAVPA